jgi:hypothetical protein
MQFSKWLNYISIRNKLLLYLLIPTLAIFVLTYHTFEKENEALDKEQILASHIELTGLLSDLIIELQNEREFLFGLVHTGSQIDAASKFFLQVERTDAYLLEFQQFIQQNRTEANNHKQSIQRFNQFLQQRKILFQDILTSPIAVETFQLFSQGINQALLIIADQKHNSNIVTLSHLIDA